MTIIIAPLPIAGRHGAVNDPVSNRYTPIVSP